MRWCFAGVWNLGFCALHALSLKGGNIKLDINFIQLQATSYFQYIGTFFKNNLIFNPVYQFAFLEIISLYFIHPNLIFHRHWKDPNLAAALAANLEARRHSAVKTSPGPESRQIRELRCWGLKSKRVWVLVRARPSDGISCIAIVSRRLANRRAWSTPNFCSTEKTLTQPLQYTVVWQSWFQIFLSWSMSRRRHIPSVSVDRPRIEIKWSSATPTVLRPRSFSTRCEAYIMPLIDPKHWSFNRIIF